MNVAVRVLKEQEKEVKKLMDNLWIDSKKKKEN